MTAIRNHAPDASDAPASASDDAPPINFDDDPSIAIELVFEWYAALFMGLRLGVHRRYAPPEGLVERAYARHRADSVRLFLEHWSKLAGTKEPLTNAAHKFASQQLARVIRIAFDAVSDGVLAPVDLDRFERFRALEQALTLVEVFHLDRLDVSSQ